MGYQNNWHRNDPKKMTSKFASKCKRCLKKIKKGDEIYYFPIGKSVYCKTCGKEDFDKFQNSIELEENTLSYPSY